MHYIKDSLGNTHTIEEYGWDKEKITLCIDKYKVVNLKIHYRHECTWDDHMGNTSCGYYVNVPIPTTKGIERKRVYLDLWK